MASQDEVVLVGGAYADARRALQPNAAPLEWPAGWRALESCTVLEVCVSTSLASAPAGTIAWLEMCMPSRLHALLQD
jgi:hypothetical protein